jgi:hypothetical protein
LVEGDVGLVLYAKVPGHASLFLPLLLPLSKFSQSRLGSRGLRIRVKRGVGADLVVFLSAICICVSNVAESVLMILRVSKLTAGLFPQISFVPLLRRQKKWSSVPLCRSERESRDFCLHRRRFSVGIVASPAGDESRGMMKFAAASFLLFLFFLFIFGMQMDPY